jgi:hypothetical protein
MKSSFIYPVAAHRPCHMISWQPQVPTLPSSASCCRVVVCLYHMYSTCDTNKQVLCNDLDTFNNNDNSNEGGQRRGWMVTSGAQMGLEIADASPAPRYIFLSFFNALLICFIGINLCIWTHPHYKRETVGPYHLTPPHTTPHDPPSLQTRDGGSFPPHTTSHDPPSLQMRDSGSLPAHTTSQDPPSPQTRDGGSFPPHTTSHGPPSLQMLDGGPFSPVIRHGPPPLLQTRAVGVLFLIIFSYSK